MMNQANDRRISLTQSGISSSRKSVGTTALVATLDR
jgi:hypothetical protein